MKEIELLSGEPAGVHTIDEEADRPEAIHKDKNGVFVICKSFALREPIPAEPLPEERVTRPTRTTRKATSREGPRKLKDSGVLRRLKNGDDRVVYTEPDSGGTIRILRVGHRRGAYPNL